MERSVFWSGNEYISTSRWSYAFPGRRSSCCDTRRRSPSRTASFSCLVTQLYWLHVVKDLPYLGSFVREIGGGEPAQGPDFFPWRWVIFLAEINLTLGPIHRYNSGVSFFVCVDFAVVRGVMKLQYFGDQKTKTSKKSCFECFATP